MSKIDKSVATAAVATALAFSYRVIVRGSNADGVRKRFVTTVPSDEAGTQAHEQAGKIAEAKVAEHKLDAAGLFYTVYPPVGFKCDGSVSKGWKQLPSGDIERIKAAAATA